MAEETLYKECPLCNQGAVVVHEDGLYRCTHCDLSLKERSWLGLFKKGHYVITGWGEGNFTLAQQSLAGSALPPDLLKVVIGNVYTDQQLAAIAQGSVNVIRPVRTMLAQVILEQLNEECFLQVNNLRRGQGAPLAEGGHYVPERPVPREGITWQDRGNLFCTNQRLVFPSNTFTFIRLDRKLVGVQAFTDGLAVQRKGEDFATYFVGGYAHEAALVVAYVIGKLPALQPATNRPQPDPSTR